MRAYAELFILVCLLLLVGTVTAGDASTISKTSGEWIIANGADHFDVTVNVRNSTGAVNGAIVTFSVNDPVYGTINPDPLVTGPDGLATRTFTVGTKSGTALI
ncbi:MAG TPA: hypothetical protein VLL74_03565, partial [Methanoregula sp.]|nr:hypothetical protein [Methanoregula sp.]